MQRAILTGTFLATGLCGLLMAAARMPPPVASSSLAARTPPTQAFLSPRKHTPPPAMPRPPRGTFLALVYAGNGQGEVEPCG